MIPATSANLEETSIFIPVAGDAKIGKLGAHEFKKEVSPRTLIFLIFLTCLAIGSLISLTVYEFTNDFKEDSCRKLSLMTYGTGFGMGIWLALTYSITALVLRRIFRAS